jgi:hypothetical protein
MVRIRAMLLVVTIALATGAPPATAQVVTPPASPMVTECRHPALPPGTPTPLDDASTPESGMEDAATPAEAEDAAAGEAPIATPDPTEGEPADQATIERVLEAELNLFHCFNIGDALGAAALYTPEALQENMGLSNPYDLPALLGPDDPPTVLIEIRDVRVLPDGRIRYQDRYEYAGTIYTDLNYLVERDGFLLLAKTIPLKREPVAAATPSG